MIQDQSTKMAHANVQTSTAPPAEFIDKFSQTCALVECQNEFVTVDQGGELCGSQQIQKVFQKCGHAVFPTTPDASRQNSVEHCHQTIANALRTMLIGANSPAEFWHCCLPHLVHALNFLPSA